MEKEINLVELLKNCPKGMELDCTMYENLVFSEINLEAHDYPITATLPNGLEKYFTSDGRYELNSNAKCVIFPKGKTTWEGFHRPFKDGDIISDGYFDTICIFKGEGSISGTVDYYCGINDSGELFIKDVKDQDEHFGKIDGYNFATEEEKQELFNVIKSNGYRWNAETKTLEKLIIPKFKVGDCIIHKKHKTKHTILKINKGSYTLKEFENGYAILDFDRQNEWEIAPNKFDINTLKPFESKVLVRDNNTETWEGAIFSRFEGKRKFIHTIGGACWVQCVPYEENKHLLGKTDDCDEHYKTWE